MPWILFERGEPPAPVMRLPSLKGEPVDLSDFRGSTPLALFFPGKLDCPGCWEVIGRIAEAAGQIREQGAEPVVVLPQKPEALPPGTDTLTYLIDEKGELARKYHDIFEFDTEGNPMVFILNRFGVPFRAWVDTEPEPDEIMKRLVKYMEANALLCPE